MAKTFVERRDVFAVQHDGGAYHPEKRQLTRADLEAHLAGERTLGHYLVDPATQHCRVFAFDIDLKKEGTWVDNQDVRHEFNPREAWLDPSHPARPDLVIELRCLAEGLASRTRKLLEIPVAVVSSGSKGLHVYGLVGSTSAAAAKKGATQVLESFSVFERTKGDNFWGHREWASNTEIEVFPKQAEVKDDGFGNLLRLPLGINRKSGKASRFVHFRCRMVKGWREMDPVEALSGKSPWDE